jgi:hypothetical protein
MRNSKLWKSLLMVSPKTCGVKTTETRKLYWWLRCGAVTQSSQEITVFMFAIALQPRQNGLTLNRKVLGKSKEQFFTGLIFKALVLMMWLTTYGICIVLKVDANNMHCQWRKPDQWMANLFSLKGSSCVDIVQSYKHLDVNI